MIEIHNNFSTNLESQQLIDYYNDNINREFKVTDDIYNFKGVDIKDYKRLFIYNKLNLISPSVLRVQLVNETLHTTDYFHSHHQPWSYVLFLSDNFKGGELILDNITIKPKRNQLLVFPGNLKHKVNRVISGDRYTFISFTNQKSNIKDKIL